MKAVSKKIMIPGLMLGAFLVLGTTTYAFGGSFNSAMFSGFSSTEQEAIEDAYEIMEAAREEAEEVLEAAGVDREEIREARQAYKETQREDIQEALASGDYDAFEALVAGTPRANTITEEIFEGLVEAHELRADGDQEGAREIMEELREDYDFAGGFFGGKGQKGERPGGAGFRGTQ